MSTQQPPVVRPKGFPSRILDKQFTNEGTALYHVLWDNNEYTWVSCIHSFQEPSRRMANYYDLLELYEHPPNGVLPKFNLKYPAKTTGQRAARAMSSKPRVKQPESSSEEEEESTDEDDENDEMLDAPRMSKSKSKSEEVEDKVVVYHRTAGNQKYKERVKPLKFKVRARISAFHWNECHKCGRMLNLLMCFIENNTVARDRLSGDPGALLKCSICSSKIHLNCQTKTQIKINKNNTEFTCVACLKETPYCFYCDFGPQKLPILESDDIVEEELAKADAFDKAIMFRCLRCEKNAHMSCLIHHYAKEFGNAATVSVSAFTKQWSCVDCMRWDADIENILTWRDVEVVVGEDVKEEKTEDEDMTDAEPVDVELKKENPEDTEMLDAESAGEKVEVEKAVVVAAPTRKEREYLVKFQELSHIHNTWVPEYWLHSIRRERAGLKRFLKKVEEENSFASHRIFKAKKPDWPKSEADVVDSEWIRVGKLLDVEFKSGCGVKSNIQPPPQQKKKKRSRSVVTTPSEKEDVLIIPPVADLESVLVKWAGLPYDVATWEMYPNPEDDVNLEGKQLNLAIQLRSEIAIAFEGYKRGLLISYKAPQTETPKFVEKKVQPVGLKGGTLKDYQMDGLKYVFCF